MTNSLFRLIRYLLTWLVSSRIRVRRPAVALQIEGDRRSWKFASSRQLDELCHRTWVVGCVPSGRDTASVHAAEGFSTIAGARTLFRSQSQQISNTRSLPAWQCILSPVSSNAGPCDRTGTSRITNDHAGKYEPSQRPYPDIVQWATYCRLTCGAGSKELGHKT